MICSGIEHAGSTHVKTRPLAVIHATRAPATAMSKPCATPTSAGGSAQPERPQR
jgi:hypothetical protein